MRPILFDFPFFGRTVSVYSYGLLIGLAVVLWGVLAGIEGRRRGHPEVAGRLSGTLLLFVAAIYAGGKGLYWLTTLGKSGGAGGDVHEGFVFYGAMLTVIPVLLLRGRALGMRGLESLDVFAAGTPLAHALGRLGCFLAGCCYGHRSTLPWAVSFPAGHALPGVPLHPVQLYEAIGLLALHFWIWGRERHRPARDGRIFLLYIGGYSVLRAAVECFRGDPGRRILFPSGPYGPGDPPAGLPTSVLIAALTGLAAFGALWLRRRQARAG